MSLRAASLGLVLTLSAFGPPAGCTCLQPATEGHDGGDGSGGSLGCANDGGPVATGLVTVASGLTAPSQIAVDCQSVYWISDYVGTLVMKAPIGGGAPVTLASGQLGQNGIAIDSTSVYWTAAGRVFEVAVGGGTVTTLVPTMATDGGGFLVPQQVVVRDGYVYFSDQDTTDQMDLQGLLMKVPTSGGSTSTAIAPPRPWPSGTSVEVEPPLVGTFISSPWRSI